MTYRYVRGMVSGNPLAARIDCVYCVSSLPPPRRGMLLLPFAETLSGLDCPGVLATSENLKI